MSWRKLGHGWQTHTEAHSPGANSREVRRSLLSGNRLPRSLHCLEAHLPQSSRQRQILDKGSYQYWLIILIVLISVPPHSSVRRLSSTSVVIFLFRDEGQLKSVTMNRPTTVAAWETRILRIVPASGILHQVFRFFNVQVRRIV